VNIGKIDINSKNSNLQSALSVSLTNENFIISEKLITLGAKITTADKRIAYEVNYWIIFNKKKIN
jgi:hypothetical protein